MVGVASCAAPAAREATKASTSPESGSHARAESTATVGGLSDTFRSVLARLDPDTVATFSFGPAPRSTGIVGPWLYATVNAVSTADGREIRALWETDLATGATAEAFATNGADLATVVHGSSVSVASDGTTASPQVAASSNVPSGQSLGKDSDEAIEQDVRATVARYGLDLQSVRVLRPLGAAPIVHLGCSDLRLLEGKLNDLVRDLTGGTSPKYDGLYLEIVDPERGTVVRSAASVRAGTGRQWVKPGLPVRLEGASA